MDADGQEMHRGGSAGCLAPTLSIATPAAS